MPRADKETLVDKLIRRAKNNKVIAGLILLSIVIGALAALITQVDSARRVFWPPPQSPPIVEPSQQNRPPANPEPEDQPKPEPAKPTTPSVSTKNDRVFAHCIYGVMPSVMPPEGRLYVVEPREQPEWIGNGFTEYFGKPGSEWKFTSSTGFTPAWGYRCELANYSEDVVFNLTLPIGLTFRESLPVPGQEKSRQRGKVTLQRNWTVDIPKLDPAPALPYVFYVWNKGVQRFIFLSLPKNVLVEGGRRMPLVQSKNNLIRPLNPDPFN